MSNATTTDPAAKDSPRAGASRNNAKKSTGPRTKAGKRRSSRNALRHGLYASDLILKGESPSDYINLLRGLESEFKPQTPMEFDLIAQMAHARWRMFRLAGSEKAIHDARIKMLRESGAPAKLTARDWHGKAFFYLASGYSSVLSSLDRAESKYQRLHDRALWNLIALRKISARQPAERESPSADASGASKPGHEVIEFPGPEPEAA